MTPHKINAGEHLSNILIIFEAQDEKLFLFYRLNALFLLKFINPKEVVVVCGFTVQQHGLYDWFYPYDMGHNVLSR